MLNLLRDSEPIRLLETPRALTECILIQSGHGVWDHCITLATHFLIPSRV